MPNAAWLTLAGVVITALVSYLVAHRQRSGSIRTTEAKDLWEKFREHNEALSAELGELRVQLRELGMAQEEYREAAQECEQRVLILQQRLRKVEADTEAAKIIADAIAEAAKIKQAAEDLSHGHEGPAHD